MEGGILLHNYTAWKFHILVCMSRAHMRHIPHVGRAHIEHTNLISAYCGWCVSEQSLAEVMTLLQ